MAGAVGRRRIREQAISLFYEAELKSEDPLNLIEGSDAPVDKYLENVIKTYSKFKESIDNLIAKHCIEWEFDRLSKVDKAILRLAVSEFFLKDPDVGPKIVISEANELADEFSSERSPKFINGVLSAILKDICLDIT